MFALVKGSQAMAQVDIRKIKASKQEASQQAYKSEQAATITVTEER